MRKLHKIKKWIFLAVLLLLCITCRDSRAVNGEESTVTMTEFDSSEAARRSALAGKTVTISDLKEFRLFQKHLHESADGLAGLSFRQTAEITSGDYFFTYDEDKDRCWIERMNGDRVGALDMQGQVYAPDGYIASSIEDLGLSDLVLQSWEDATWFAGNYDGQGHSFHGFLLGMINGQGSTYGGLFCDLKGGTIRNVNVSTCYMNYCMSPLVNAMCGGTIENCHVSNVFGSAECGGGIAGLLWQGTIQDCTVEYSVFQLCQGYQEGSWYGGLGGVVGVVEQNSGGVITNCQVSDTVLRGADFSQVGTGGIVGVVNTGNAGSISISDCSADVTIYGGRTAGGIAGRVQKDGSGTVSIRDCVCSGSMIESADSGENALGGILGKLGPDVSQVSVNGCISQMIIEKNSKKRRSIGTAGGIIGSAQSDCLVDRCVFAGRIVESETAGAWGQMNLVGGIVGEMTPKGTIENCVNFGDVDMGNSQQNVCGGLVGWLLAEGKVEVVNSLVLGRVTGKIAGGLFGRMEEGENSYYRIHNNLALGEIEGTVAGYLGGEATGTFSYCYGRGDMAQAFGSGTQEKEYCRQVSAGQLAGTEQVFPIFDSGEYAGIYSVKEILNAQASLSENCKSYALWEDTKAGYPLPEGMVYSLPFALPEMVSDAKWIPLPLPAATPVPSEMPNGMPVSTSHPAGAETIAPTEVPAGTETFAPSGAPAGTETAAPTEAPAGTETAAPTGAPAGTETAAPTEAPAGTETFAPTGAPVGTGTSAPSGAPAGTETAAPIVPPLGMETAAPSGISISTAKPVSSEIPVGTEMPSGSEAPKISVAPRAGFDGETDQNQRAAVKRFRGKNVNHKSVVLTWKKNAQAAGYCIYRSGKESSGYREMKQCPAKAASFRDKKCKPGRKYYYQIRAVYLQNGKMYQGKVSRCTVKLPYLKNPAFRLSKGKNTLGERYLQITMGRHAGKYVDIYLRGKIGYYRKIPMVSHKISRYGGKIRFTYQRSGVQYRCKIRTYKNVKGKKRYSGYSKVKKIRL